MIVLWICTVLMACAAAFYGFDAQVNAKSAPQQAAGAAITACLVLVPYVFARAIEAITQAAWRREVLGLLKTSNDNFKAGIDSLWKQLEAQRARGSLDLPAARPTEDASTERPHRALGGR